MYLKGSEFQQNIFSDSFPDVYDDEHDFISD